MAGRGRGKGRRPDLDEQRFWKFATERTASGCLLWTGTLSNGYGMFSTGGAGKSGLAHRWAYTHFTGRAIGFTIDHLCHDPTTCAGGPTCPHRRCVEITHLADTTNRANILRGGNTAAQNARKTACKRDHPFSPENTYLTPDGRRSCRTCDRDDKERNREHYNDLRRERRRKT